MGFTPIEANSETTSDAPARGFTPLEGGFTPIDDSPQITGFTSAISSLYNLPAIADAAKEHASVLRTVPPALVQGYSGLKGAMLEEAINATTATGGTPDPQSVEELKTLQSVSKLAQEDIETEMKGAGLAKEVGGSAVQSLAVNMPGLALSALTRSTAPGLLGATAHTYGQSHAESIAKTPDIPFERRENAALGKAFAEGMFERASLGYLLDRLGKDTLGKLVGKYVVAENATEIPTTIAQNLVDWAEIHPEKSFKDWAAETGHDVLVTALSTPLSAGPLGGMAGAMSSAKDVQKEATAEKALRSILTDLSGGNPEAEQIVGDIIQSIRTQQYDPETAEIQRAQFNGKMANIPDTPIGLAAAAGVDDLLKKAQEDRGGVTQDVTERRESDEYSQFATADQTVPSAQHLVVASATQPELVGLRLGQMPDLVEGSVTVVGGNVLAMDTLFPGMLPEALAQTVQKIANLAGISEPIILNLTQPEGETMSWYHDINLDPTGAKRAHVITPRELPSFRHQQGNQNALIDFAYSLAHEIGHALKIEQFEQGIARSAATANVPLEVLAPLTWRLRTEMQGGTIAPETLQALGQFAPTETALLTEWQRMRQAVLAGQMTGKEFADQWIGPRKLALGFNRTVGIQSIYSWVERETRKDINSSTALEVVQALGNPDTVLNFDEFMAEQFSRAAHDRNYLKNTTIGEWFQNALMKLRQFFAALKAEGIVKPTTQFNDWLDQTIARQPKKRGRGWGKVKLSKELKKSQKAQIAEMHAQQLALQEQGEQDLQEAEVALPEEEELATEASQEQAIDMLNDLVKDRLMRKDSEEYKRAMAAIAKGQTGQVIEKMFDARMGMKVHWDRDRAGDVPTTGATEAQAKEAEILWRRLKFDSPFFKRWFGNSVLVDAVTGEPITVYRGDSFEVPFFDLNAARYEKVIFFARSAQTAQIYANDVSKKIDIVPLDLKKKRDALELRAQIDTLAGILEAKRQHAPNVAHLKEKILRQHKRALEENLNFLLETSQREPWNPTVGAYYLRMENPFIVDFEGDSWQHGAYDEFINTAKANGHDGLIVHNVKDPIQDTLYILWDTTAAKNVNNSGEFTRTDNLFWDKTNGEQSVIADSLGKLGNLSPDVIKHSAAAFVHRLADALVQLQQRAIKPLANGEVDIPMQAMLRALQLGQAYKNSLMQPGEVLTKELEGRSQADLDRMFKFLQAEWKGGESWFALQGWTAAPHLPGATQIWGDMEDGGRDVSMGTGVQVKYWTYVPTEKAIKQLNAAGVDTTVPHGQEVLQLILQMKQTMLDQFSSLEHDLMLKIANRAGASALAHKEIGELYQVMQKIRLSPFMPQGHFGNYSIVYQTKKENASKGERKYKTTRIEYFETRGQWQAALRKAKRLEVGSNGKLKVAGHRMEDYQGIPLQLPRNLLTNLENTGHFTKEQLEVMAEMMIPVGVEKISTRYLGTWSGGTEGSSEDLLRVYSNFIWHNANYIWKQKFRTDFAKAIAAQEALVRRAAKGTTELSMVLMDELDRNTAIMRKVQEYVLHPPQEYHQLRLVATMVYLAYNIKTAVMNLSTMINTYAALTTEFGEVQGHRLLATGAIDAARLAMMRKDPLTKHVNEEGLDGKDNELAWMYNRAISEGLIDQSYAYFLAGQANATSALTQVRRSVVGKLGRIAMDLGMLPFRTIEKGNRLTALTAFFEAERVRGADIEEAYLNATKKMELTQGAYDAGNRAEAFRGGKALFTMFYTYTQMMAWHTTGGYAKGMKAELARRQKEAIDMGNPKLAEKLAVQHMMGEHAYTVKLLMIYLLLGGLTGLPFADNIKDLIVYMWRKAFETNPELEFRQFIKSVGGGGNWYNDPDLVMNGMLHNVAGMDLSGSFSLGRMIPGTSIINRDWKSPEAWLGAFGTQAAGPFGGFLNSLIKALQAMNTASYSANRVTATMKVMPGAIGAVGKAIDAAMLQSVKPTYGVLGKTGERLVEDPPGSGKFRDLTNWELIGTALGGNPTVLSSNREKIFFEVSEQIYWRTRTQGLLDARNKAIVLGDESRQKQAMDEIQKFNNSLDGPYKSMRITGKQMSDSLRQHRKSIRDKEADKVSRKLRGVEQEVKEAF